MGDQRTYSWPIVIRCVSSEDGMTADFYDFNKNQNLDDFGYDFYDFNKNQDLCDFG